MGKPATAARKRKRRAAALLRRRMAAKADLESLSVEELLAAAQEEIDSFQYETAQTLCHTALKKEPDNVAVLETSASLCLEVGNLDGARHCLGRAITVQPEGGHEKYMSMAQLMEGREALQCYQKGIEILTRKVLSLPVVKKAEEAGEPVDMTMQDDSGRNGTSTESSGVAAVTVKTEPRDPMLDEGNENLCPAEAEAGASRGSTSASSLGPQQDERAGLVRQMSTAYCSVAELFMTDLCDEEEAEEACRANILKAIEVDPSNPEAFQHMASFLLVKQEVEEAKKYIAQSLEVWLPQYRAVREGKAATGSFDPVEVCPLSYATRLTTARILIEVEDHKSAVEVLEGLTEEDDEVVDVWYLMGWSHYLQGEEQREAAQYCLHRALKVHSETPCEDSQLVEHMQELMEELGPYIEKEEPDQDVEEELEEDSEEDEEEEDTMDTS
ncbi:uncharacterized protein LOC135091423 [Scylla paramamosain]|uniref:uncharacterized protein LOC135091423 n=1 Tax=Scylla paramamosain TaxID=85552 RepID=UPI0030837ADB